MVCRNSVLVLCAFILGGCGSMQNRADIAHVAPAALEAEKEGVVIFSVGAPMSCISISTFLNLKDAATHA